jgi:hypothetical protein
VLAVSVTGSWMLGMLLDILLEGSCELWWVVRMSSLWMRDSGEGRLESGIHRNSFSIVRARDGIALVGGGECR